MVKKSNPQQILYPIQGVNYEHIPKEIAESHEMDDCRGTGLYSVDRTSKLGQWLESQGFTFDHGTWGWIGIWN